MDDFLLEEFGLEGDYTIEDVGVDHRGKKVVRVDVGNMKIKHDWLDTLVLVILGVVFLFFLFMGFVGGLFVF